ncbi:hypothetical protein OEZ86_006439 [Tetradesmus obliquus]|nr:hypothetical protein OEZ86_006439 [Tetradesmus obliquus]
MGKEVAEIVQLKGCFSLRPRRLPTLDVLTAASAAAKVLQDDSNPAMVWLDMEQEALFLTERWSGDVVTQRMPLSVEVQRLPKPVVVSAEETVVATAVIPDRDSVELFLKLSLQVLQDWLSIRQGALGRNLLTAHGHWVLGYHGQALRLLCPGAEVAGLLRLNLSRPGIELLVAQAKGPVKTEVVSSLQLAGKVLKKHAHARRLNKAVQQSIQSLQPCLQSLQQLKSRLDASARGPQAAANM